MKRFARTLVSLVLIGAMPIQAIAGPHAIAELGTAPLIGQIASTAQLQADVSRQRALFAAAGSKLGLTPREYAQFASRIGSRQLAYVIIPRHLDAMSWSSGGNVYVLHDVIIPANTHGWEIDLQESGQEVALFVPARCGNLSILRRSIPRLASAGKPHLRRTLPVAMKREAPQVAPPAPATASAAAPPVAFAMPAASPTPAPLYEALAPSRPAAAPVTHRPRLWPLLALIPIAFFLGGHGSSSPSFAPPGIAGGPIPGPSPVPGCPTPAPVH